MNPHLSSEFLGKTPTDSDGLTHLQSKSYKVSVRNNRICAQPIRKNTKPDPFDHTSPNRSGFPSWGAAQIAKAMDFRDSLDPYQPALIPGMSVIARFDLRSLPPREWPRVRNKLCDRLEYRFKQYPLVVACRLEPTYDDQPHVHLWIAGVPPFTANSKNGRWFRKTCCELVNRLDANGLPDPNFYAHGTWVEICRNPMAHLNYMGKSLDTIKGRRRGAPIPPEWDGAGRAFCVRGRKHLRFAFPEIDNLSFRDFLIVKEMAFRERKALRVSRWNKTALPTPERMYADAVASVDRRLAKGEPVNDQRITLTFRPEVWKLLVEKLNLCQNSDNLFSDFLPEVYQEARDKWTQQRARKRLRKAKRKRQKRTQPKHADHRSSASTPPATPPSPTPEPR